MTDLAQPATDTTAQALGSAAAIAEAVERLDTISPELDDVTRVIVAHVLNPAMRDLRVVVAGYLNRVGQHMQADGRKMAVVDLPDGTQVTVEQTVKVSRKDVDREALLSAVDRASTEQRHRMDVETGEVAGIPETRNRMYRKLFRFEPRWTDLRNLGIDDDEFCRKEFEPTVKVTEGGRL